MAMDREAEVRRLNEGDIHISDAERRVTEQSVIVERLHAEGGDAQEAERLLKNFRDVLGGLYGHRELIVDMIRRVDAGLV